MPNSSSSKKKSSKTRNVCKSRLNMTKNKNNKNIILLTWATLLEKPKSLFG